MTLSTSGNGFLRIHNKKLCAGIVPQARTHGFHMFRHSAGSIVHAKTGDLKLAQVLLGHARI